MRDQISTRIADVTKTVTEGYTETNERVLDAVVENSRKAAEFYVKTADQVADRLPDVDLPFDLPFEFPTPAEAADRYIELVERVVEMNRDFSERIVKLNRDYTDRVIDMLREETPKPATKATTRPAAKPAARKAAKRPAKKAAKKVTASK